MYSFGQGVEEDWGKQIYHLEEATIRGHPDARYSLGFQEEISGNIERAVKHWTIAAKQGHDESIKALLRAFKHPFRSGLISKEELAATLRAQKAAVDATKSPQRKEAEEYSKYFRNR